MSFFLTVLYNIQVYTEKLYSVYIRTSMDSCKFLLWRCHSCNSRIPSEHTVEI